MSRMGIFGSSQRKAPAQPAVAKRSLQLAAAGQRIPLQDQCAPDSGDGLVHIQPCQEHLCGYDHPV
jgi:hypothetical protein